MHQTLIPRLTGALHWAEPSWGQSLAVLAERPRRCTLQRLPEELGAVPSHGDTDLTPLVDEDWEEAIAA